VNCYFPDLIFAHRALAPALILALASGDMVNFFLGGMNGAAGLATALGADLAADLAVALVCAVWPFVFAHLAF
jgi:hypothetical protein